jgi:late competence protein required for DNA uptake (superfamily II DNA/RNA helicase)
MRMSGVKCQECGKDMAEDEIFITAGKTVCEDCYITIGQRIRTCDPWGEHSKRVFRESHGLKGTEGLTDRQKEIYKFVEIKGKVTGQELIEKLKLTPADLENQFAILRQCQLLKGKREGDKVYIVLW